MEFWVIVSAATVKSH